MSPETLQAITQHLEREAAIGSYQAATEAKPQMEQFYARVATLVRAASASEIAYMDSASRAWNMVIYGLALRPTDEIVTLSSEFGTNLITLVHRAKSCGATVHVVPCDSSGAFDLAEIERLLGSGARFVALSHAAAHGSIVNPVEKIGELAKRFGALYVVDGCQAAGQIPVDVDRIQCHAYTATGRKWLAGPRGTGFLYVRADAPIQPPQLDLAAADLDLDSIGQVRGLTIRTDARRFELWERSVACMLGLSSAIDQYLRHDPGRVNADIVERATLLRQAVLDRPNLQMMGTRDARSGIVGFYLKSPGSEPEILARARASGIALGTMSDWDCPLHFPRNGAKYIFRMAPTYHTPLSTIDAACAFIRSL